MGQFERRPIGYGGEPGGAIVGGCETTCGNAKSRRHARSAGQLVLFVSALALVLTGLIGVRRHVINPLITIRDAMLKLIDGDLSIETSLGVRRDEIGALARALSVFRSNALEKAKIEEEQRLLGIRSSERHRTGEAQIVQFEQQISRGLGSLVAASDQMRETPGAMTHI
jgi:HAMP domain-containing protein